MKVKSNLSTLMGMNRYSIQQVHEKTGLSRGTISKLYYDQATRIDYATISKLCELFECDVNKILMLENNNEASSKTLEQFDGGIS